MSEEEKPEPTTESSDESKIDPDAPEPETETKPEETAPTEKTVAVECPSSPTKEHDMFHNEGTDETYCRYCGKT